MYTGMCNAVSASKKLDDVQSTQISLRSSTFRIYILFMIIDLIDALSRSNLSLLSVILIPTLAISPNNVRIIYFPSRKIFCLHFQRLLRLMCYTEISMNFSTTWAPGNSYYRFGGLLMCIHRKKLITCPCWDLQCSPVSQGR